MKTRTAAMRDALVERIHRDMGADDRIYFLSADFGSPALDRIREEFPERYINVGIAEQNLINITAGLALEGCTVYAYAIASFLTMRAYEQIRINLSLTSQLRPLRVSLIGVGAGISYDVSGPTHHCLEDITIMRALPNMRVFSPSDWVLAEKAVEISRGHEGPTYVRLDSKPLPNIYAEGGTLNLSEGFHALRDGEDVCLVSTGYMTHHALKVAAALERKSIKAGIVDLFLLKTPDEKALFETLRPYRLVVTMEEAFIGKGGLDSLVGNLLRNGGADTRLVAMGFEDRFEFRYGSRESLYRLNGLDERGVVRTVLKHGEA